MSTTNVWVWVSYFFKQAARERRIERLRNVFEKKFPIDGQEGECREPVQLLVDSFLRVYATYLDRACKEEIRIQTDKSAVERLREVKKVVAKCKRAFWEVHEAFSISFKTHPKYSDYL
jgi:hypothetical protein